MGNLTSLNNSSNTIDTGKDAVVIVNVLTTKPGGASLDVTGFAPTSIGAGHVVIKETATGLYKPMPVSGAAYDSLPSNHTYEGVVMATVLTAKPIVGILYAGTVNGAASPYPPTSGVKSALTQIKFIAD